MLNLINAVLPIKQHLSQTNPNKQVSVLTKTVLKIFGNFIPHETILVDDRDLPITKKHFKHFLKFRNSTCNCGFQEEVL